MDKLVLLLSGGLDSQTCLAIARSQGFEVHAISFDYGQRNKFELLQAKKIAQVMGTKSHKIVQLSLLRDIGGSALTDEIEVPKDKNFDQNKAIPVTYVPARNTIFLSLALAYAEIVGASKIMYGANVIDYSEYLDCRPDFVKAFEDVANFGTKPVHPGEKYQILTPLITLSKADIVRKGIELGVDYTLSLSCYDPPKDGVHCGRCGSCFYRKKGFLDAGVTDPTYYLNNTEIILAN